MNASMGINLKQLRPPYIANLRGVRGVTSTTLENNMHENGHMQTMVKTWNYIACKSPKEQVQGVCIQDLVKFKGNHKFSFDFSLWDSEKDNINQAHTQNNTKLLRIRNPGLMSYRTYVIIRFN